MAIRRGFITTRELINELMDIEGKDLPLIVATVSGTNVGTDYFDLVENDERVLLELCDMR